MSTSLKRLINNPLIKLVFSFALLYFVFRQIDIHQVFATIIKVPIYTLVLFTLFWSALYFLSAWRWSLILFKHPDKKQTLACFKATLIGLFYNLVMPSAVGGDLIKWTALSEYQISKKKLIFTVFLDRFVGLVGLVMSGLLSAVAAHSLGIFKLPTSIIVTLIIITILVGLGWLVLLFSHFWLKIKFLARISFLYQTLNYAMWHRSALIKALLISIAIQILSNLSVYFLAQGVGFHVSVLIFFILEPIVAMITAIPVSFAGLGTTEAATLYFFTAMGELPTIILAFTTLLTVFRFMFGLVGWLVLVSQKKTN